MIREHDIYGVTLLEFDRKLCGTNGWCLLPGDHIITSIGGTLYQGMVKAHPGYQTVNEARFKADGEWCDQSIHINGLDPNPECVHVDYYRRMFVGADNRYDPKYWTNVDTYGADPRVPTYNYPYDYVDLSLVPQRFMGGSDNLVKVASKLPAICKRCNAKNDYAEPNQKDGTYVCFECR